MRLFELKLFHGLIERVDLLIHALVNLAYLHLKIGLVNQLSLKRCVATVGIVCSINSRRRNIHAPSDVLLGSHRKSVLLRNRELFLLELH